MAYLSLKYCGKSVKTYAGNLGHLTMSHRFFFVFESCYWRYNDEHDVFISCISFISFPNPEDLRPFPLWIIDLHSTYIKLMLKVMLQNTNVLLYILTRHMKWKIEKSTYLLLNNWAKVRVLQDGQVVSSFPFEKFWEVGIFFTEKNKK